MALTYTPYQDNDAEAIREALAELERPADDDENDAYDVALGLLSLNNSESTPRRYATVIEQYAETYHARKLAEDSAAILAASDRLGVALDESDKGREIQS